MNLAPFLFLLHWITIVSSLPAKVINGTLLICCQPDEYFNVSRYKCEPMPNDVDVNWNLHINFLNETEKEVNILTNLTHTIKLPCKKPEALYWQVNETVEYEAARDNEFCYTPFYSEHSNNYDLVQMDCRWELNYFLSFRHEYMQLFSGLPLVPTLIIYIVKKPLNSNLMGKCFICYLSSVLVAKSFYFIIPQMLLVPYRFPHIIYISIGLLIIVPSKRLVTSEVEQNSKITGLFHFYLNMALTYWLNVLGIDAWKNFSETHEELNSFEKKRRFYFYSIYAWSMGAITTIPTILRNLSFIFDYCGKCKQSKSCVSVTYGTLYLDQYFAPTIVTILFLNFLIFCSVAWKVYKIRSKFADTIYNQRFFKENVTICLRLLVLMGPQWIFMFFLKEYEFVEVLILTLNYIDSILIFILFVLRKSVLKLLFKK